MYDEQDQIIILSHFKQVIQFRHQNLNIFPMQHYTKIDKHNRLILNNMSNGENSRELNEIFY